MIDNKVKKEIEKAKKIGLNKPIQTKADYDEAMSILKQAKELYKSIDNKRKELTRPIDESKKRIMAFFKPPLNLLKEKQAFMENEIREYIQREEEKRREAERDVETLDLIDDRFLDSLRIVNQEPVKTSKRTVYDFEVIDENIIPREYLTIDEKKIKTAVQKSKGEVNIPGIKIVKRIIIVNR